MIRATRGVKDRKEFNGSPAPKQLVHPEFEVLSRRLRVFVTEHLEYA